MHILEIKSFGHVSLLSAYLAHFNLGHCFKLVRDQLVLAFELQIQQPVKVDLRCRCAFEHFAFV